jgi:acyl dehydratase
MVGVSVADTTLGTLIANLSFDAVKFPKPVAIGDTLRTETTVVEKRESRSRPNAGIVTFEHQSFNQRGEAVASCRRTALMKKRP